MRPTDAVKDPWNSRGNEIACYKYAQLVILKAKIDLADEESLSEIDDDLRGKVVPNELPGAGDGSLFSEENTTLKGGFQEEDLTAGDQIYIKNPYWDKMTDAQKGNAEYAGEQGSNLFNLGDGKVVSLYGGLVYGLNEYIETHIIRGFHCLGDLFPDEVEANDFVITRVHKPIVTDSDE